MTENELKLYRAEKPENVLEKKKKRFFSGLKNRLLAMALTGFLTLGVDWSRGLSQYLGVEDKEEAIKEFIVDREITDRSLADFKAKVGAEEPDFLELVEGYEKSISVGLDKLKKEILELDNKYDGKYDQDLMDQELQEYESLNYPDSNMADNITIDHKIVADLKSNPDFFKTNNKFLKENSSDIFWALLLLNDSKDLRDAMVKFTIPPDFIFKPHAPYGQNYRAITNSSLFVDRWQSEVTFYPTTFSGLDRRLNSNTYINLFIHELTHAITAGYGYKNIDRKWGEDFGEVLDEGRTQSLTYKIVRYLKHNNQDLKPIFEESEGYDQYLVIAEIMESIARTHHNSDFVVDWQSGRIDYKTMLEHFQTALRELNLSSNIYKQIIEFKLGRSKSENSIKFLKNLLSELKLGGVNLSDDFVGSILKKEKSIQ